MSFMGDLSHLPPLSSDEMAKKENDMNRRDFLKSLVAIGVSIALPGQTLASASDELIDQAWHKVIKDPITFYVNEWGCLSTSPVEYFPDTRLELFDLNLVSDKGSLIELSKEKWRVQDIVEQCMNEDAEDQDLEFDDWLVWLNAIDQPTLNHVFRNVNWWLENSPDEADWEEANLRGQTDRGDALWFFRDQFEYCDLLNVVIIEGDHPGSSYFAAELRMDIAEANEIAEHHEIPIRFAEEQ
jgi:hypothetical protein